MTHPIDAILIERGIGSKAGTLRLQSGDDASDRVLLLLGSGGRMSVNGRSTAFETNSFALFPFTGGRLIITMHQDAQYEWYHIRLSEHAIAEIASAITIGEIMLTQARPMAAAEILRILSEHAGKQDAEVLCSHAICLLIQLLIQGQAEPRKKEATVPHFEKLAALRAEIYQHPEEDWSIQEICERLCISRPYFHRIYQAAFDVTCTQDVIDSRILRAKQLLETTEEPIADISALCGFETDVYFMRQFKRHVGMTPTVYRRMCRNTEASDPLPGRTLQL